jgi:hypothetical protein
VTAASISDPLSIGAITVTNALTAGTLAAVTNATIPTLTVGKSTATNGFKTKIVTKTAPVSAATNWTISFSEPSVYWVPTNAAMYFSLATNFPATDEEATSLWRINNNTTNAVTILFNPTYFGTAGGIEGNRLMLTNACTIKTNSIMTLVVQAFGTNLLTAWKDADR